MRKVLLCVPMMTLLLAGCSLGTVKADPAEELALAVRGEYLELAAWSGEAEVSADYGQRVYQYQMTAAWDGEETVLTLTAPETVAGLTARLRGDEGVLEYDGLWLETGNLDDGGLSPATALPVLVEQARSGYITACALEDGVLRVDCGDPEGKPGQGRESVLWFDGETYDLLRGEISVDGFRVISCEFLDFTKEKEG